ncbi:MAG: hypothetical protein GY765_11515 [bacterium]|nr:hypothetical protein [bacterium]
MTRPCTPGGVPASPGKAKQEEYALNLSMMVAGRNSLIGPRHAGKGGVKWTGKKLPAGKLRLATSF